MSIHGALYLVLLLQGLIPGTHIYDDFDRKYKFGNGLLRG